jgi:hypothetical protein
MAIMPATKRSKKVQIRLRPNELEALERIIQAMGISQTEALRGWIAAGLRGALPIEGVLMPQAMEPPAAPAEAISA